MNQTKLKITLDKTVNDEQMITDQKFRFTLLGNRMIRVEYSPSSHFEEQLSTFAVNRKFDVVKHRFEPGKIETEEYILLYSQTDGFESIKVKLQNGNTTFSYHEEETYNLKGTYRTLDGADGEVPLEKGLFSLLGFASLDDTASPLFNDQGWMVERKQEEGYKDVYFFFFGTDYLGGLKEFAKLSGKTPLLPRFALGNWWSRYYVYTEDSLKRIVDSFEENQIPLSVCIIDMDWHITDVPAELKGGWTGYTWNKELFPDPKRMLDYLHDQNLMTSLNLHPADGIRYYDDCYIPFANAMGINPQSKKSIEFDIFNPTFAENYFIHALHPHEDMGVDFWWIDWQQGRKTPLSNLDPLFQLNHLHFLDESRDHKRGFTFSRYPGMGGHRYPIGFSGDSIITWKSLAFQPYFTATASNIGFSWWSHDIGGHCGGKDEDELYARWLQFGVFSPIMRMHSTNNEFIVRAPFDRTNPVVLKNAQKYLYFRQQMIPYLYSASYQNYVNAEPLVQPLYYRYPKNSQAYRFKNEYFFGQNMLVHPVTKKIDSYLRVATTKTLLMKGTYYDLFTHQKYAGNQQVNVYSHLYHMPVFVTAGSIIPLAKLAPLNLWQTPKNLEVLVFPGKNHQFDLYEDDGVSNEYLQGKYCITHFVHKFAKTSLSVTLSYDGDRDVLPKDRSYEFKFVNIKQNSIVSLSRDLPFEQTYDEENKTLIVTLNVPATRFSITIKNNEGVELDRSNEFLKKNLYEFTLNLNEEVDNKREVQDYLLRNCDLPKEELVELIKTKVTKLPNKAKKVLVDLVKQAKQAK